MIHVEGKADQNACGKGDAEGAERVGTVVVINYVAHLSACLGVGRLTALLEGDAARGQGGRLADGAAFIDHVFVLVIALLFVRTV